MWESKYLCVNIRFRSQLMIIVALQMKNINHMYMTTWLVLHAAINLQAKQSKAKQSKAKHLAGSYTSQAHYLSH